MRIGKYKTGYKLFFFGVLQTIALLCSAQTGTYKFPFQNTSLPFEQRVQDLVSRLTLEEKVAQMLNATPAIDRLGIPAYEWWNEVLHGVARTPYKVTVYPQAIAMAATFDTLALKIMADYAATEGRAVYNKAIAQGKAGNRYIGLTYWTPNINIFRDPRWGRGQETYGEDPFLTAMLGKAFVHGLQGDDPIYWKAAACAKHYAVHSGPEPLRHNFNVNPSSYDLWNTYLPAFEELITKADVAGVMCAYNAYEGQPCCGSDPLMNDILRKRWKFDGYVTSDCGGIDDFFKKHKTHAGPEEASIDAVVHGTDLECGKEAYMTLIQAVKSGKITEKTLDASVRRLFMVRFRLGMFDPPSMVKYARTAENVLESPAHQAHALKMARSSIVLLKNNNILPLSKNSKTIAVIGPNADNPIAVLGNYNGTPSTIVTPLQGIRNKLGTRAQILYEKGVNYTNDSLFQSTSTSNQFFWQGLKGFQAEYYSNKELKGEPFAKRIEEKLDNEWQEGEIFIGNRKALNFSARYTTDFTATETETTFELLADEGYRFYIDGKEVLNGWKNNAGNASTYRFTTEKGKIYRLVVEYFQAEGKASVHLNAGHFVKSDFSSIAARFINADVIVFVGGISPQLEGESMRVEYPGFKGGDRTSILLPAVQTELLKALQATGKPVVFVMMTGSAIAIPWEAVNTPAIINAWYGGQSAGTALADVLFGDYNPSGRLPVTFYASDKDLPDFSDYSMKNRTYRYFSGRPLYGFGFGLSYTTFAYSSLKLPLSIAKNRNIPVSVIVKNTGGTEGEEVVQLYVSGVDQEAPIRSLRGFQRVFLKAGESKEIRFLLTPQDLSVMDDKGLAKQFNGPVTISVGGGQPDENALSGKKVLQSLLQIK